MVVEYKGQDFEALRPEQQNSLIINVLFDILKELKELNKNFKKQRAGGSQKKAKPA